MVKSPDAFRTIREVAEWLDTPAHVLRFWESRFTQVKPVKRAGGRRYYRPSDMELLGGIKQLLHEDGLTIRGVQKLLREQGVRHVAAKSPALGLETGPASAGEESASAMARRVRAPSGQEARTDLRDPAPSPAVEGIHPHLAEGAVTGRTPERHAAPNGSAADTSRPAASAQVSPGHAADMPDEAVPPDTAQDAGEDRTSAEAPTSAPGPILATLWDRRLSGSLGDTGPVLARARALLRSMNARD